MSKPRYCTECRYRLTKAEIRSGTWRCAAHQRLHDQPAKLADRDANGRADLGGEKRLDAQGERA